MVNLSISVDMIPKKERYVAKNDIVYISVTFDNDVKVRDFVKKVFVNMGFKSNAVVIEDASLNNYMDYFQNSHYLILGQNIIATNVDYGDILNVISNWCFYEVKASIYLMDDKFDWFDVSTDKKNSRRFSNKDFISIFEKNATISIHQELDYTVNICCKKRTFNILWEILKKEDFNLL